MSNEKNILICFGTRPEYIKVKSLIINLPKVKTCFTGQHIDLLKDINVDYHLDLTNECQNRFNYIFAGILKYSDIFDQIDYVLVQGDTTTACAMAISAFNHGKKIIHLEAGLRSGQIRDPFPEEMNRQMISRLADIHFCATENNKQNLLAERVSGQIFVVGQTGLDGISRDGCSYEDRILITLHRYDNFSMMDKWFNQIEKLATKYPSLEFLAPLHPNPAVQKHRPIFNKVKVVNPMSHIDLINYVKKCKLVISDSGGLQEECSYLNKKIIVCRRTSDRPETVGTHSIMCPYPTNLENIFDDILNNYHIDEKCPYGDGASWKNIVHLLKNNK